MILFAIPPLVAEWMNLLIRWIHVIAAIMWIGDSFLFMWLDSVLTAPSRPREGAVAGEMWMAHSGGFYEVVKRRFLAPGEVPSQLYFFKWQAFTTWITGFLLLVVVYYIGAGTYLVDPATSKLGHGAAVGISLAILFGTFWVYDRLWMALENQPKVATAISLVLLGGLAWLCTAIFAGRAAYLQFGASLGSLMVSNVAMRIVPSQNQMMAATRAGTAVDTSLGLRAKSRSIHNHYLTLPVLFTMLSNHFPSTYGHAWNAVVLLLIVFFGMALKYVMNERTRSNRWVVVGGAAALIAVVTLTVRPTVTPSANAALAAGPRVGFDEVHSILQMRCLTCHSAHPTHPAFPQPPSGIILEDPRRVRELASRIQVRVVETKTMPLGNLTGMTDEERVKIGAWIAQGANIGDAGTLPR